MEIYMNNFWLFCLSRIVIVLIVVSGMMVNIVNVKEEVKVVI